jgi:tetratricopeptide (TPR) repeat protein
MLKKLRMPGPAGRSGGGLPGFQQQFARFEQKVEAGEYETAQILLDSLPAEGCPQAWLVFGRALLGFRRGVAGEAQAGLDAALRDAEGDWALQYRIGWAYAQLKCWDRAEAVLAGAAKRPQPYPEAISELGAALWQQKRYDEALVAFGRVLQLRPDSGKAFHAVGTAFAGMGDQIQALACFEKALALEPSLIESYVGAALAAFALMDPAGAEKFLLRALDLDPGHVQARLGLGVAKLKRGDVAGAREIFEPLSRSPDTAHAGLIDAGALAMATNQVEEAQELLQAARKLKPDDPAAHVNLGSLAIRQEKYDEAIAHFRRALAVDPANDRAASSLGMALLTTGQFSEGWDHYERRFAAVSSQHFIEAGYAVREGYWKGEDVDGKTVVVWREQGMGDEIHFVRYAVMLARRGAHVVLECSDALSRLFRSLPGNIELIASGAEWPPYDYHSPLLSLPRQFGTALDSIPCDIPYLRPEPLLSARWAARLPRDGRLRVGLVWGGGEHKGFVDFVNNLNRDRNIALEGLALLLDVPGVQFVSLQKGGAIDELQAFSRRGEILDFESELTDFADTAALIGELDLVISVDTSVVHLAGALGKPVWVLSRLGGCWRWLNAGEASPWYPQARIFRQQERGNWAPVVDALAQALRHKAGGGLVFPA